MWCRPSTTTTTTTTFTNQQDFATNELLFSATSFLFIAPVSWKLLWEQNIWAWVCEMISAQLLAAHLSQIYRICYETVTKDSLQCEFIGTFFHLQTVNYQSNNHKWFFNRWCFHSPLQTWISDFLRALSTL